MRARKALLACNNGIAEYSAAQRAKASSTSDEQLREHASLLIAAYLRQSSIEAVINRHERLITPTSMAAWDMCDRHCVTRDKCHSPGVTFHILSLNRLKCFNVCELGDQGRDLTFHCFAFFCWSCPYHTIQVWGPAKPHHRRRWHTLRLQQSCALHALISPLRAHL